MEFNKIFNPFDYQTKLPKVSPITNVYKWEVTIENKTDPMLDWKVSPVFEIRFGKYPVRKWQMKLDAKSETGKLSITSLNQGFVTSKFSVEHLNTNTSGCTWPRQTWDTCLQSFRYGTTCETERHTYLRTALQQGSIKMEIVCTYTEFDRYHGDETQLSGDLNSLVIDPIHSDFVIENGGKSWKVHKAILSARSPVFRTMFESSYKESKQNCSEIKDMDPGVIDGMIRYIYTGKVPNLESISAEELLMAADKYQLPHLKEICGKQITSELTVGNACHNLVIADLYSCSILKTEVLAFIKRNSKSVVQSDGYKELSRDKSKVELLSDIVLILAAI